MSDGRFPFGAIELVHVANRIEHRRPVHLDDRVSMRVHAIALEPHPRGRAFTIVSEARVAGELVWRDETTIVKREAADGGRGPRSDEPLAPPPANAQWRLPGDLGRRYAAVSGDRNPIHMHSLSARLFGFPSAIAHGMWTKSRCLAALEPRLPDAFTAEVAFKRPILLPATVTFAESGSDSGFRFGVRDARKDTPHLDGDLTFG
jgi:acyl dehydratase